MATVVMLLFTYCTLQQTNESLRLQKAQVEAVSRPYLSVLGATLREGDGQRVYVDVFVVNHGLTPATRVDVRAEFGGVFTSSGEAVIAPRVSRGIRQDASLYPNKPVVVEVVFDQATWEDTASWNGEFQLALAYRWQDREYSYESTLCFDDTEGFVVRDEVGD